MRKRIYEILDSHNHEDKGSKYYGYFMIVVIVLSILPLAFKNEWPVFIWIDRFAVTIFIIDYILRWITADIKYGKMSVSSFLRYPFSFFAIIDLISILPSFTLVHNGFKLLRLMRALRILRVLRVLRYSKNISLISTVFRKQRTSLTTVGTLAIVYIIVSALVIFNVEPDTFNSFFDALYWATVSLTTMGYGDIYPITTPGRIITMISSILGIAIVALPAGIITAGYMTELEIRDRNQRDEDIE